MNDFGLRLEAALRERFADYNRKCTEPPTWDDVVQSVRAANAQVSAPAPCGVPLKPDQGQAGAGVDLAQAMIGLSLVALGENRFIASYEARALLSYIESLERDAARYRWLMDASSGNSPLARANRIYARWNGEDGAEGFSRVLDAARKEGKP